MPKNSPRAVAFDVFSTLLELHDSRNPWKQIAQFSAGHAPDPREVPVGLKDFASLCSAPWNPAWAADLDAELSSIRIYPDVVETLRALRSKGYRLALISNLAQPYVPTVRSLLGPLVDVEIYSCQVGAAKPRPKIFAAMCAQLDLAPNEILMVGDSQQSDIEGACRFGMPSVHLRRDGPQDRDSISELSGVRDLLFSSLDDGVTR